MVAGQAMDDGLLFKLRDEARAKLCLYYFAFMQITVSLVFLPPDRLQSQRSAGKENKKKRPKAEKYGGHKRGKKSGFNAINVSLDDGKRSW